MKYSLLALLSLLTASAAKADGFKCVGQNTGLNIKVFNQTNPQAGTRTPAILIIANPLLQNPNQTIATFSQKNQTLDYLGHGKYSAKVDLRYSDSGRKGENIAGTKLGELANIVLDITFAYDHNSIELAKIMDEIPGTLAYQKRSGEVIDEKVTCQRYLKN